MWDIFVSSIKWMLHWNYEKEFSDNIDRTNGIIKKTFDSDPIYNKNIQKLKYNLMTVIKNIFMLKDCLKKVFITFFTSNINRFF